ncbi:TolC family protein [Tundrisphaera sp. TA3]|uniref:TolC family protein n=1 Tax=Tundrisphaera sp. TA3 TaxID=3435775 RepID=UPI003EC04097
MNTRRILPGVALGLAAMLAGRRAEAQSPTIPEESPLPGANGSTLGRTPGSGSSAGNLPGEQQILGGRAGTSTPRVPTAISTPGAGPQAPEGTSPTIPTVPALSEVPLYGTLALPSAADEGPENGLTYDQALDRMLGLNLELTARRFEIPLAQADILTASLRANPIFYADAQLVPYGNYTKERPGGQTQYDVNISYPLDVTHKRRARTEQATAAKRVVEAQYQDAVRIQIANLSTAYLAALEARETVRYAEAGVRGLEGIVAATRELAAQGKVRTNADVARLEAQRAAAELGVNDALDGYRRARVALAGYLAMSPAEAEGLELRASLRDPAPPPPSVEQLTDMALRCRPDVVAFRLGVASAGAGLKLQKANRLNDIYVLYQPYTYQNNAPINAKSPTSWALGVTVPLPIYNRNQGNIERAKINIDQTRVQLAAVESQAVIDVRQAEREYARTRDALERLERNVLPPYQKAMEDTRTLYESGEADVTAYLTIQREYNDQVRLYRDTAVRHRRAMLGLNTAVGTRIMP